MTKRKRHTPEQIVRHLQTADRLRADGASNDQIARSIGVSDDECLNMNQFITLLHAQVIIGDWKQTYNALHRHSSLDYQTPNEYAAAC